MRSFVTLVMVMVLVAGVASMVDATVWDLAADFSTVAPQSNETGPWYYGSAIDATSFYLLDEQTDLGDYRLWRATGDYDGYGNVGKNVGLAPVDAFGFYMEPGTFRAGGSDNNGWLPGALWRCSTPGDYQVTVTFTAIWWADQNGPTDVKVLKGSAATAIASGTAISSATETLSSTTVDGFVGRAVNDYADAIGTAHTATWTGVVTLAQDETIMFLAGGNGAFGHTAGVAATITSVPEPSCLAAFATGVIGLAGFAIRRRRA